MIPVAVGNVYRERSGHITSQRDKPRLVKLGVANANVSLLEIDIEGARQVRRAVPDALLVFLAPPSWDELARRLSARGTEPPEVIARRLELAASEIEAGQEFDITLVNTSVKDVCEQLVTLVTA